jgi:hypothetical protein
MIASHAFSRVWTRSRNAQFSASRAASAARCSGLSAFIRGGWVVPARRALFSASSSLMRASRATYCALRLSRLCWAAIRLRWARASLRSSGVMTDRDRFRGAVLSWLDVGAGRDFAGGLEVAVDGRDGMGASEECDGDGDGDGRARSEVLTVAMN